MFTIYQFLGDFTVRSSQMSVPAANPVKIVNRDPTRAYICVNNYVNVACSVWLMTEVSKPVPNWLIAPSDRLELFWERHGALCTFELWGAAPGTSQGTLVNVTEMLWVP